MMDRNKEFLLILVLFGIWGCNKKDDERVIKPRPVEVAKLVFTPPPESARLSAVVASWKTEEIGMEVGGRVKFVLEPNEDVNVEVKDETGKIVTQRTMIAELDKERFQLQVDSAAADEARADQAIKAAEIEIDKIIPQRLAAAMAEQKRAKIELERSELLVSQQAGSRADVDRDDAALKNATAQVEQIKAEKNARKAELESLKKDKLKALQALKDANRSFNDCELYSDFAGQISEVHVVPGSVVSAGQPIATLQMMDPIKIELEVSAEVSRQLRNRQRLVVWVTREDGSQEDLDGFLYQVDSVADTQTRTFTINLLAFNERLSGLANVPEDAATTPQTWRLDLNFLPGVDKGALYAPKTAIHQNDDGSYFVWRVTNVKVQQTLPKDGRLEVVKMPIRPKEMQIPFLGTWTFQKIEVDDPSFVPSEDMVVGKIDLEDGDPNNWEGTEVYVERNKGQWKLRPGDLVQVDLTDNDAEQGVFVSMDAVTRTDNKNYLFLIDEVDGQAVAKQQEVIVLETEGAKVSSVIPIRFPANSQSLIGREYVTKGTHYLRDGEPIRVVSSETN